MFSHALFDALPIPVLVAHAHSRLHTFNYVIHNIGTILAGSRYTYTSVLQYETRNSLDNIVIIPVLCSNGMGSTCHI